MRKLATAAFSFAAAIFCSRYIFPYNWLPLLCAAAAAFSFAGLFFRGVARLRIFIVFLALASGFVWSWAYTAIFVAPSGYLHEESATVSAVVIGLPSDTARGQRVDIRIDQAGHPSIGARLYYNRGETLNPGDAIEFTARFRRTDGYGESERIDALSSRGSFLAAYVSGEVRIIGAEGRLRFFPQRVADAVADIIERLYPDDVYPFMQALLTGRRDQLNSDRAFITALSASGISHVVAISGMHVTFLMGFLAAFVKNKRLFAFIALPVLLMFMAMTGFAPSVTRAGIMQMLLICAPIFRRESDIITSISAALLVLLAANPYSIASVGLQLSFAATVGIVLITGRIDSAVTNYLRLSWLYEYKAFKSVSSFVITSLATTVGALVFTIPLTALHFGYVSLVAPLTNLLTLWVVSIVFPLGLASCILGFIVFPLGSVIAFPVSVAVRYIIGTARLMAAVPYSLVYTSNSPILFWLAYLYAMFSALPLLKARARQYLLPVCFASATLCIILLVTPLLMPGMGASSVTVLNVGQGQSVAILSDEHTAIVDCGGGSGFNAGAAAHEFLANRGRTSVELLIITHFHADHINGVEYLMSMINVAALAIPDPEDSLAAEEIIELARMRGTDVLYVTETYHVSLGEKNLVLYPPLGDGDENERGLSVLSYSISGGPVSLITGDMASPGERALLRYADLPVLDLLVIGHHGSRHSTSEDLLAAVSPTIGVVSVGNNSYGHPSGETLARLEEYYVTVFRTDTMGDVIVRGR